MKNFIKKTSWFQKIMMVILFMFYCFSQYRVYESIYNNDAIFVTTIFSIKNTMSFCVLLIYVMLCILVLAVKEKNDKDDDDDDDDDVYSDFPPHQQRVFEERDELEIKYINLSNFIYGNKIFKDLLEIEQLALKEQYAYMERYLAVLNKRISRF